MFLKKPQQKQARTESTNSQHLIQPLLNLYKIPFGKLLLVTLFFILPWNLGKHFENSSSFVDGEQIPYLIFTIYLQDLLVAAIVLSTLFFRWQHFVGKISKSIPVRLFLLFLFSCFLSLFFTDRLFPSLYLFMRVLLYFLFFVASAELFFDKFVRRAFFISAVVNVLMLSLLSFAQFSKQSSVFSNYLFFGEQPYNIYTPFIAKESFSGVSRIPPYGTFEHPNVLAGFLTVLLVFVAWCFFRNIPKNVFLRIGLIFTILFGFYTLFLTRSYTAWAALFFCIFLLVFTFRLRLKPLMFVAVCVFVLLLGFFFPFYKKQALLVLPNNSVLSSLSVERRSSLLDASYRMFLQRPFFGWGLNSFTFTFSSFYTKSEVVRFFQPVHNVYFLIASEIGVFGALFFVSLILYVIYYSARYGNPLYSIVLVQTVFLSSFDHYFFTIHQTQILFVLTLLLALTYTENADCL